MIKKGIENFGIFFLTALSLLPLSFLYFLSSVVFMLVYHIIGYRRKVVRQNLVNAFPEKDMQEIAAIEKTFFRYFADLMVETVKMATISKKELQKRFRFKNMDILQPYFERNEGVLLCSAHYGNWEWGTLALGMAMPADNYPIYKPLSSAVFDRWFFKIRSRFGNKMISMRQTLRALSESKGKASAICFGSDQSPARHDSHYWTTFLHQPASVQLGVEKIARKTNRPVFYLKVTYLKRGYYEVNCLPVCLNPAETSDYEITEAHTRILENIIRTEPAYWLWSHKRWKNKPEPGVFVAG